MMTNDIQNSSLLTIKIGSIHWLISEQSSVTSNRALVVPIDGYNFMRVILQKFA